MSSLERCFNLDDFRRPARRRLPRMIFDYLDGGADDEVTMGRNRRSFSRYQLVPRVLRDVSDIDLATMVQGRKIDLPVILSPTGQTRVFHHRGEAAVAAAAARAGTIYTLSSVSSTSIEDAMAAGVGAKWFQIYVWRNREVIRDFMDRCRDSGYHALCLTVDVPLPGNRERDLRNGLSFSPSLKLRAVLDGLAHPRWLYHYLTNPRIKLANVVGSPHVTQDEQQGVMEYIASQFDTTVDWDAAAWMVKHWGGPFLIKGVLHPDDARKAVEIGASGIILSNHGGRQLDHAPAALDMLPEIAAAVAGRAEILIDGGIRRGSDVIKALALGATACMIGRPYLYALAAFGEAGVTRMFALLREEIRRDMALLGCPRIANLSPDHVRRMD